MTSTFPTCISSHPLRHPSPEPPYLQTPQLFLYPQAFRPVFRQIIVTRGEKQKTRTNVLLNNVGKCIFQKFLSTARVYTTATAAEQGSKVYKEHKDRLKIISWNPYSHHSEKKKKNRLSQQMVQDILSWRSQERTI